MPEINYKALDDYLAAPEGKDLLPVYLIHGEESLYKSAFNILLDDLLPSSQRGFNYDPIEGVGENLQAMIERMNTFSLLSGTKIIAFLDAGIFHAKQDHAKLFEKSKEAATDGDLKAAGRFFVNALNRSDMSFDAFDQADKAQVVGTGLMGDGKWVDQVYQYCLDHHLSIPRGTDGSNNLEKAIEKGFPTGNHLIITTDYVDKRRSLFKSIREHGLIIDCSVPKGGRRDDRMAQEAVLKEETASILERSGKTIEKEAFFAAVEMTGFDIRTFCSNIEKLVNYIGDRSKITVADVESVLKRSKQDPIYELTNAVSERNMHASLFYLDSLLSGSYHPLQVLAAIINQMRKLLTAKGFLKSEYAGSWDGAINYPQFRQRVMPHIADYDQTLSDQLDGWNEMLFGEKEAKTKKSNKKKKMPSDLFLARSSRSPFPIFQILKRAESYTEAELIRAIHHLHEADTRLKSAGQNPKLILESMLFQIMNETGVSKTEQRQKD